MQSNLSGCTHMCASTDTHSVDTPSTQSASAELPGSRRRPAGQGWSDDAPQDSGASAEPHRAGHGGFWQEPPPPGAARCRADKVCSSRRCSAGCVRRSERALPAGERAPVGPEPAAASLPSFPTSAPPRPRSTDRSPPAARRRPCRWASRRPGRRVRAPAGAAGRGPATRPAPP